MDQQVAVVQDVIRAIRSLKGDYLLAKTRPEGECAVVGSCVWGIHLLFFTTACSFCDGQGPRSSWNLGNFFSHHCDAQSDQQVQLQLYLVAYSDLQATYMYIHTPMSVHFIMEACKRTQVGENSVCFSQFRCPFSPPPCCTPIIFLSSSFSFLYCSSLSAPSFLLHKLNF